jgi:hypothetical protein
MPRVRWQDARQCLLYMYLLFREIERTRGNCFGSALFYIHRLDPFLPVTTRALSWKLGYFMLVYSLSEAVNLLQHTREYACLVSKIKHTHNPCAGKEKQLILLVTQH